MNKTIKLSEKNKDFFAHVYQVVKLIPKGRVTSYGAIAKYLASPKSSRMVGWAMNACHTQKEKIPAHRVVNRAGMLTGKMHFSDPDQMQKQLEKEGIKIKNDQVQSFDKVFWDPITELE